MLKVKLLAKGKSLTPYVAKVTTNGRQQKRFRELYGIPVGNCVRARVHRGMTQTEIRNAVKECAGRGGGTNLREAI